MAALKLTLTTAGGGDLNDHVSVHLFSLETSAQFQSNGQVQREMVIDRIAAAGAGTRFRVMVTPQNHRVLQFIVTIADGRTAEFATPAPVDPAKVVRLGAPAFDALPDKARECLNQAESPRFDDGQGGFLTGPALYAALERLPLLEAGFLNIIAKAGAVRLQDGQTCLQHFGPALQFEQDRVFFRTTAALVEETGESNAFQPAPGTLHDPLPGYKIISSFKTFDKYGNLQLTFQRRGEVGSDYVVDVDIDDAQGIEHIFQVLRNSVRGPTHPYDIHDILLEQDPKVDPGYTFVFATGAAIAV